MKRTCREMAPALLLSVHGEISLAERAKLAAHLLTCPDCRAKKAKYFQVTNHCAAILGGTRKFTQAKLTTSTALLLCAVSFSAMGGSYFLYARGGGSQKCLQNSSVITDLKRKYSLHKDWMNPGANVPISYRNCSDCHSNGSYKNPTPLATP